MRDMHDSDGFFCVVGGVNDTIVTYPNSPLVLKTSQLLAACGPWVVCQRQNVRINASKQRIVERIQLAPSV
jgi:hypothetical protein